MAVGLVLEGGGMRGLYTAGVLDTFLDAGIKVDGVVSVSRFWLGRMAKSSPSFSKLLMCSMVSL